MDEPQVSSISRRDLLKLGGAAVAAGSGLPLLDPRPAAAQTPKRGGTFRIRIHVAPVHFDPQQTVAFPPCRRCLSPIAGLSRSRPAPR